MWWVEHWLVTFDMADEAKWHGQSLQPSGRRQARAHAHPIAADPWVPAHSRRWLRNTAGLRLLMLAADVRRKLADALRCSSAPLLCCHFAAAAAGLLVLLTLLARPLAPAATTATARHAAPGGRTGRSAG